MSDQEILAAPALRGARPRRPEAPPEKIELFEPPRTPHFLENCVKNAVTWHAFHATCALLETVRVPDTHLSCLTKGESEDPFKRTHSTFASFSRPFYSE